MARVTVLKKKALSSLQKGKFSEAGKLFEQVCKQSPLDCESWMHLGDIRTKQGLLPEALKCFQKISEIAPSDPHAMAEAANVLSLMGRHSEARLFCERSIRTDPSLANAYYYLGNVYREQSAFDAAEQQYRKAVQLDPSNAVAFYYLANMCKTQGRVDEAIDNYNRAIELSPKLIEAEWNKHRILPVIFDSDDQIESSRKSYHDGINHLFDGLKLDTTDGRRNAKKGLITSTNFYLQYQGRNDLELQCEYGEMLCRIMQANYPQWTRELDLTQLNGGEKIRIGYVSGFLYNHNGAVWLLGWLRNSNTKDFEIYCYHTGGKLDDKTEEFKQYSDHFYHIPSSIENLSKQIRSDNLHILVYPELGMDPQSMLTAGLRLAPIQCVGWGHPITSGLPTMDYWLSSDLMEPPDGHEHYSEKLIRLPNMANCYSKFQHDQVQTNPATKKRNDFGLPDDAVLYFCSQSLFKYLPQYDYLWPEIAKKVPGCKFIFLAISSVHVVTRFMARVEKAFANVGLNAKDYCIMLNRQTPEDYLALNQLVDVFLDNPPWSGNNTGLAAIDCHLPIVCFPTKYMRGRHSYAILKMLGVTETIAESEQQYIEIAARLGNDVQWREEVIKKISDQHERIYEDTECVSGLEEFYREVVAPGFVDSN